MKLRPTTKKKLFTVGAYQGEVPSGSSASVAPAYALPLSLVVYISALPLRTRDESFIRTSFAELPQKHGAAALNSQSCRAGRPRARRDRSFSANRRAAITDLSPTSRRAGKKSAVRA